MILTKLKLVNFRNYKKLNIQLNKNLNIFIGPNAQGKTNILESIYILAITKSHRSGTESNLIRIGDSAAKISGTLKEDKLITDLEVDISPVQKKVFRNQSEIKKISNYIGNLNVIMFCPDDLDLLKKSPVNRRNYLNIQISQLDGQYLRWLNEYNKILKTKNEYLKVLSTSNRQTDSYLETLEEQLIVRAVKIYELRMEYISRVNNLVCGTGVVLVRKDCPSCPEGRALSCVLSAPSGRNVDSFGRFPVDLCGFSRLFPYVCQDL